VDERFVPRDDSDSNERLLRNCFSKNSPGSYDIKGMVLNDQDKTDNLRQVRDQYQLFIERTDIVVLGMGKDGHTA
jgi:6-phosphogluconolactonase